MTERVNFVLTNIRDCRDEHMCIYIYTYKILSEDFYYQVKVIAKYMLR